MKTAIKTKIKTETSYLVQFKKILNQWYKDPVIFSEQALNFKLADYQQEVLRALANHNRVAVRSGHGVGKTELASVAVLWFLCTRPFSKVITTASVWRQVNEFLWPAIHNKIRNAKSIIKQMFPAGDKNKNKIVMHDIFTNEKYDEWYAIGVASDKPENLEGAHAEYILYVVDEAKAVPRVTFEAIEGALTTNAKLLVISTPASPTGYFYDIFTKYTDKFKTFHIPSTKSLFVSKKWIEDRKREWGESSPVYRTRVLGEFADNIDNVLISLSALEKLFTDKEVEEGRIIAGLDIARFGVDKTVLSIRKGNQLIHIDAIDNSNLMYVVGWTINKIKEFEIDEIRVDECGLGAGVLDRLIEQGYNAIGINVGQSAENKEYYSNLKAELYWQLKRKIEDRDISILNSININYKDKLIQELTAIKYDFNSKGQIKIIDPEKSPDFADATMLCFSNLQNNVGVIEL